MLLKKIRALQHEIDELPDPVLKRQKADILLSFRHLIKPKIKEISLPDLYSESTEPEMISIVLDEKLSPSENIEKAYSIASKTEKALIIIPKLIEELKGKLNELENLEKEGSFKDISRAEKIEKAASEISIQAKYLKEKDIRTFHYMGYTICCGKNESGNDRLTRTIAKSSDIWFHSRGGSGSHVLIIRHNRQEVPRAVIEMAASIAGTFSFQKNDKKAEIIYTERRWISPVKGKPGQVRVQTFKTILIAPISENDLSKLRNV